MSSNSSAERSETSRRAGRTGRAGVAAKSTPPPAEGELTKQDFERLAALRHAIRRLVRQTELEARRLGISPQQYLLMLTIKGFPGRDWANITELAEYLQIRHNAVIGLVNRAVTRGLVVRMQDADRTPRPGNTCSRRRRRGWLASGRMCAWRWSVSMPRISPSAIRTPRCPSSHKSV